MNIIPHQEIESKILLIRGEKILIDKDIAEIYGVETKRINEAVKNNKDKFPDSYLFQLSAEEFAELRSKDSSTKYSMTRIRPKAFTEKGLYMIATILKSKAAREATFLIIETFAKLRELNRSLEILSSEPEEENKQSLLKKSGTIISELLGTDLSTTASETTIELNLAVLKLTHTVKKSSKEE